VLSKQMNANQARLAEQDKGESNSQNLSVKLENMQNQLHEKDIEIANLTRSVKEIKSKLSESQKKSKQAEEGMQKLSQQLKPKLQAAIEQQKFLFESYNRIREDTQLLPEIFRAEAAAHREAIKAQVQAEQDAKVAVDGMNELRARISNLQKDKAKNKDLALKAIAARTNIKDYLDAEKSRVAQLEQQCLMMQQKLAEAIEDRAEFQHKHDEMFNSVSALNQRIEELESHKLHLLNKLKGFGDKGGLEYIVKT